MSSEEAGSQANIEFASFGPDFAFDYSNWLQENRGGALGSVPDGKRVAIVGGGMAGMVAAYELARMGVEPIVYEPAEIGGRLRSIQMGEDEPHLVAELGGMRFPKSGAAFYHYVDLLELKSAPFPNPGSEAAGRTVVDLKGEQCILPEGGNGPFAHVAQAWNDALAHEGIHDIQKAMRDRDEARLAELWHELVRYWDDRSFWNFLAESEHFADFETKETFGQVGFGTGGWDSDFPNTMLEIFRVAFSRLDEEQHFIVGGAQQVPKGLWNSVKERTGNAKRCGVQRVERRGERFIVTDTNEEQDDFDAVLLTPQTWLLRRKVGVDEDLFTPDLWTALERTDYMSSSKTFAVVDRAFWNDEDYVNNTKLPFSMTMTDRRTRATYLIDGKAIPGGTSDGRALVILSYAWEGDAEKVFTMSAKERCEEAVAILKEIYGSDLPLEKHMDGGVKPVTVSWSTDPNFLGAFKGALPGHYRYNRRMYGHFVQDEFCASHRGIFLAGDGISWTPAWVEGAVQTALNAVWGITKHLNGECHGYGPGEAWEKYPPLDLEAS